MKTPLSLNVAIQEHYNAISGQHFLVKVNQIIFNHIGQDDFNIKCLCEKLYMSRMQLHRKLKIQSGLSTSTYIRMLKLKRALLLLQNTDLNISEIAFKLGFKDPSYFTRIFVKEFHFPPSQLRKARTNDCESNQVLQ